MKKMPPKNVINTEFSDAVLTWFAEHGRKDLPWQQQPTAYRVWVSEIMLQQTQVNTVLGYYQNFMQHFPDIQSLAAAPLDEVLAQWSGLGYYARARNLHRAAQQIQQQFKGEFPQEFEQVIALSGIGRSTAGAILALAFGQSHPILDGNVKRVLCRYHAIPTPADEAATSRLLWELATNYTPVEQVGEYTQAMMDLGATLCTRSRPQCSRCPIQANCQAAQQGNPQAYPVPKLRKTIPVKTAVFLMLQQPTGEILLEQRPAQGIWGGLWSFPECADVNEIISYCEQELGIQVQKYKIWESLRHTFTHFHLDILPVQITINREQSTAIALSNRVWYKVATPIKLGLAAPVARLIQELTAFPARPVQDCLL